MTKIKDWLCGECGAKIVYTGYSNVFVCKQSKHKNLSRGGHINFSKFQKIVWNTTLD